MCHRIVLVYCTVLLGGRSADGQALDVPSYTIDCGGAVAVGGAYELSGTTGQADAGPVPAMTGGSFVLVGGFWPATGTAGCVCPGDVNGDGRRNGADMAGFVGCMLETGGNCACADVDGNGVLNMLDTALFVDELVGGAACP